MTEYKIGNATVRIHGTADQDRIRTATVDFLKKAEKQRRRKKKNEA
jgi:hypothetical protein